MIVQWKRNNGMRLTNTEFWTETTSEKAMWSARGEMLKFDKSAGNLDIQYISNCDFYNLEIVHRANNTHTLTYTR